MKKGLFLIAIFLSTTSIVSMNREELIRQLRQEDIHGENAQKTNYRCIALLLGLEVSRNTLSNLICSLISAETCIPNTQFSLDLLGFGMMGYCLYKTVPILIRGTGIYIRLLREWPRENDDNREAGNQYEPNS